MKMMIRANSYTTLIFDLDDTLYDRNSGLMKEIGKRIGEHIADIMSLPRDEADILRKRYKEDYGSSLVGLYYIDKIDPQAYIDYVYDIDYKAFLKPRPELRKCLSDLPQRKIIYTNGSAPHVNNVLRALDLEGIFDMIVPIEQIDYHAKPMKLSFERMFALTGITPSEALFFDDQERNIIAAIECGLDGVMVGNPSDIANASITSISDISFLLK